MHYFIFTLMIGLLTQAPSESQGNSIVTVGPTTNCDFSSIQAAIDSGPAEIRVTDTGGASYQENLQIINQDLIINGAYLDCASAANGNENGFRSLVEGDQQALPVVRIISEDQRHHISIQNMSFAGGTGTASLLGGGLTVEPSDLYLSLENLSFFDNTGISGGAIAIIGGDTDVLANELQITNNDAEQGGGIYCSGAAASFVLSDSSNPDIGIYSNQATAGDGGGVLIDQECQFSSYLGSAVSDTFVDYRGINRNTATGNGGGIAAQSGAKVTLIGYRECIIAGICIGDNQNAVTVGGNMASTFGGGISAKDPGTLVEAYAVNIHGNSAISGGGVVVDQNAQFITNYFSKACWNPDACNQINNNQASHTGGAIYAQSNATAQVNNTFLTRNRADLAVVASVWGKAQLSIINSIVAFNADNASGGFNDEYLFNIFSGGLLDMRFSTISQNDVPTEMIRNGGTQINLIGSIIYDPGIDIYTTVPSGSLNAECMVLNEATAVTGSNILVGNPDFIAADDFHLSSGSIAIDRCAQDVTISTDLDLTARGFDVSNITNVDGDFDAGAYEYRPDLIFADGFE